MRLLGLLFALAASQLYAGTVPELTGRWSGSARILANWTSTRSLNVDLVIGDDGSISGFIGDAQILGGNISKNNDLERIFVHSGYTISVRLSGFLLADDQLTRERFELHVTPAGSELRAFGASEGNKSWPGASPASRIRGAKIQVPKFTLRRY